MKIPAGIVTSEQMRLFGISIAKYTPDIGVIDLTTRQSVQLRGVTIEDAPQLIDNVQKLGITTFMSGAGQIY
jgi:ferredoxin-nitrite reductase